MTATEGKATRELVLCASLSFLPACDREVKSVSFLANAVSVHWAVKTSSYNEAQLLRLNRCLIFNDLSGLFSLSVYTAFSSS